jgi:hypothetical protein
MVITIIPQALAGKTSEVDARVFESGLRFGAPHLFIWGRRRRRASPLCRFRIKADIDFSIPVICWANRNQPAEDNPKTSATIGSSSMSLGIIHRHRSIYRNDWVMIGPMGWTNGLRAASRPRGDNIEWFGA